MPPKTVKCVVCGEEVSKRSTVALQDGSRACRTHEEALEGQECLRRQEAARKVSEAREQEREARKQEREKLFRSPAQGITCWVCGKPGMHEQEYYSRLLVVSYKVQTLYGAVNPFSPEYSQLVRKHWNANGTPLTEDIRVILTIPEENITGRVKKLVHPAMRAAVDLAKCARICAECVSRHSIQTREVPAVTSDQLVALGSVADLVYGRIAKEELTEIEKG